MAAMMIAVALVLMVCVASSKISDRFGVPTLILFLILGMLCGSDGILKVHFEDFDLAEKISTIGLLFIIFYGGFGTSWKAAKPVLAPSVCLASLGVVLTAAVCGLFCYLVLKIPFWEAMLIGSILSSTDAASVFSIFRSRRLNLKGGLASLLEVESGSNDPIAFLLVTLCLTIMGGGGAGSTFQLLFFQIVLGLLVGFVVAKLAVLVLKKVSFDIKGLHTIFMVAIALLGYALSDYIGGNGYLSVYIMGIMLGNSKILHKRTMVHFFDGITWLMQIMLFFMLGLLAFPSHFPSVLLSSALIAVFLTVVARPLATFLILTCFKFPWKQQLLVAFCGLRGAASIAFSIAAVTSSAFTSNDIFHIVFLVALLSVGLQGTLLPFVSKKLGLVDDSLPVLKTFTDYQEETGARLFEIPVIEGDVRIGKTIVDLNIPDDVLVVMIKRGNNAIVPKGFTEIEAEDILVVSGTDIDCLTV